MRLPWSPSRPAEQSLSSGQHLMNCIATCFQGTSVTTSQRTWPSKYSRKASRTAPQLSLPRLDTSNVNGSAPALQSPTSTRSSIDPSLLPASSARPLSTVAYDEFLGRSYYPAQAQTQGFGADNASGNTLPRGVSTRPRRQPRWQPRHSSGRVYFSFMRKSGMRRRVFFCVVSGTILAVTLVVCECLILFMILSNKADRLTGIQFLLSPCRTVWQEKNSISS